MQRESINTKRNPGRVKKAELKEEEGQDSHSLVPDKVDSVIELPKKGPIEDVIVNQMEVQTQEHLTKKESTEENNKKQKSKKIVKTAKAEINE